MMESPARRALRDRKLSDLGPRPPWWRVFARRRWQKRHDAIMAMGITVMDEMLALHYTPESVAAMARQRTLAYLCKAAPPNPHSWTTVIHGKVGE